jgi:hypothetical protein
MAINIFAKYFANGKMNVGASSSDGIAGLEYALEHGVTISSNSYGGWGRSTARNTML